MMAAMTNKIKAMRPIHTANFGVSILSTNLYSFSLRPWGSKQEPYFSTNQGLTFGSREYVSLRKPGRIVLLLKNAFRIMRSDGTGLPAFSKYRCIRLILAVFFVGYWRRWYHRKIWAISSWVRPWKPISRSRSKLLINPANGYRVSWSNTSRSRVRCLTLGTPLQYSARLFNCRLSHHNRCRDWRSWSDF